MSKPLPAHAVDRSRVLREAAISLVFLVVYFVAARLGLQLAVVNASTTAVWAPTGIALAALLLLGSAYWPVVFGGAFLVNILTPGTLFTTLGIASGNTLEALLGAWIIRRFVGSSSAVFTRSSGVFLFVVAVMLSTALSATIGLTSLSLGGISPWANFVPAWLTWWFGDMGGGLIVAPFILVWAHNWRVRWNPYKALELLAVLLLLVVVGRVVFGGVFDFATQNYPTEFLLLPVLVWLAFRFGPRETASGMLIISGMAIWGTLHGFGPFAIERGTNEALVLLQAFMVVLAATKMVLATAALERRSAEQAVGNSERRLRALIEKSSDAIMLTDVQNRVLYVSPSVNRMLGYEPAELLGQNAVSLVHPDDMARIEKPQRALLSEAGRAVTAAVRYKHKDGSWRWLEGTATNLLHEPGVKGIVANFHDITALKQQDKVKSEFLSVAAHQLRTPLGSMRWTLETVMAKEKNLPETVGKALEKLYKGTRRMIDLVNDLLNVSKIDQGLVVDNPKTIDIVALIKKAVADLQAEADVKKVSITVKAPEQDGGVTAYLDPGRLREVVQNLLSNGIKYNRVGGSITVEILPDSTGLELRFVDTGIGVAYEDQIHIFSKFFRASNAVKSHPDGIGLGLFVVKSFVEEAGGTITLHSVEGKGSTFVIRLPMQALSEPEKKPLRLVKPGTREEVV